MILDAWSWRWSTNDNRQVPMAQAENFSVFLRIPLSALNEVLALSGWHGVFVEPRPDSKQGAHPSFVVVWLPRQTTLAQALDHKRRHDMVVGIARMNHKLGLRAYKKHEKVMQQELVHPGQNIVVCAVDSVYEVGPLLHGLSHAQIADLLRAWSWVARPLKPLRSSSAGQYWHIGTASPPPSAILHTEHGTVTVSLKQDKTDTAKPAVTVQASARTRKHMLSQPSSSSTVGDGQDPCLVGDPWRRYQSTDKAGPEGGGSDVVFTDASAGHSHTAKSRIAALEDRLMSHVEQLTKPTTAGLDMADMDTDVVAQQASEIAELRQQNEQFVNWFNDIGTRFCGMDNKMQAQQARMDEMQQAMVAQGAATQRLQTEVSTLQSSFQAELKAGLEAQTARLESLLEKRPRTS